MTLQCVVPQVHNKGFDLIRDIRELSEELMSEMKSEGIGLTRAGRSLHLRVAWCLCLQGRERLECDHSTNREVGSMHDRAGFEPGHPQGATEVFKWTGDVIKWAF